jgi:hypothetical protein
MIAASAPSPMRTAGRRKRATQKDMPHTMAWMVRTARASDYVAYSVARMAIASAT